MIEYTAEEIAGIKAGIESLAQKNDSGKDETGYLGGRYVGYLSAINDVRWLFISLEMKKANALVSQCAENLKTVEKLLTGDGAKIL